MERCLFVEFHFFNDYFAHELEQTCGAAACAWSQCQSARKSPQDFLPPAIPQSAICRRLQSSGCSGNSHKVVPRGTPTAVSTNAIVSKLGERLVAITPSFSQFEPDCSNSCLWISAFGAGKFLANTQIMIQPQGSKDKQPLCIKHGQVCYGHQLLLSACSGTFQHTMSRTMALRF